MKYKIERTNKFTKQYYYSSELAHILNYLDEFLKKLVREYGN